MSHRIVQVNLNHCAKAHDLLSQSMAQWLSTVAVICEPLLSSVPSTSEWIVSTDGKAALQTRLSLGSPPFERISRGEGYVAAIVGDLAIISVYFSPNRNTADYEAFLSALELVVGRYRPHRVLVAGDFNAHSVTWGSPETDERGELVEEWAMNLGLHLMNRGSTQTLWRQTGSSIVDLTFGCPGVAERLSGWRVVEEEESLSDHRYVRYSVSSQTSGAQPAASRETGPRWAVKRLNRDHLAEAATVYAWLSTPSVADVDAEAASFRDVLTDVCDAAMPRAGPTPPRRNVYWWSDDIARLRRACVASRRQYTRHRRRRRRRENEAAREAELREAYRAAKKALKAAIAEAKARAREEMLRELSNDPWGRPYRLARNKLRPYAPPLTQTLRPDFLAQVIGTLFPNADPDFVPPSMRPPEHLEAPPPVDDGEIAVTVTELRLAVAKMTAKNTAPGPDGVHGRVLALALQELGPRLRALLSACLEQGQFPRIWKTGKLVLLHKEGKPAESPSAYRPIVLLDETCKIFERILAARLSLHLARVGPDLADVQYGFRTRRSTVHAILRVKALVEETVSGGGVVIAVSLDISNAFNSLPWRVIREALRYHRVPTYLRRTLEAYLCDRSVVYPTQSGVDQHTVVSGVPQGSVLGPILWNIGYDWVLRGANLRGVATNCYADDTLVTAAAPTYREASLLATVGTDHVVGRIRQLGLRVALEKTEAICFHGPRNSPPPESYLVVGGVRIGVRGELRYLGITLDSRLTFAAHFKRLAPRLMGAANALGRLLPNVDGPDASCRRLYLGVVKSMALYGAPVWSTALTNPSLTVLRQAQRVLANRAIRAYRTVSGDAACLLAGSLPWDLEARVLTSLFEWRELAFDRGQRPALREMEGHRSELLQVARGDWALRLQRRGAHWTISAVLPVIQEWLSREHGRLTFRLTQVLSGHGCFGEYLCRVARREPDGRCHHCTDPVDTAQHTLAVCPAWTAERSALAAAVGGDVSLPAVVKAGVCSETAWDALLTFCEVVMGRKEEAEREREVAAAVDPQRARRTRRRRRDDTRPP